MEIYANAIGGCRGKSAQIEPDQRTFVDRSDEQIVVRARGISKIDSCELKQ